MRSFGAIKPIERTSLRPDEELSAIIEKMMKIDLKARYQTMDEVVADLERYERRTTRPRARRCARRPARRRGRWVRLDLHQAAEPVAEDEPAAEHRPCRSRSRPWSHKSVLCVEAQDEIQDVLRKTLTEDGLSRLLVSDAELAAERYRESPADAVIFDTDGQGDDAIDSLIDMHDKSHEDDQQLVALVLLGPKPRRAQGEAPERRQDHRALQADQDEGGPGLDPSAPARRSGKCEAMRIKR